MISILKSEYCQWVGGFTISISISGCSELSGLSKKEIKMKFETWKGLESLLFAELEVACRGLNLHFVHLFPFSPYLWLFNCQTGQTIEAKILSLSLYQNQIIPI